MSIFQKLLYFFSHFTDPTERKVGKFFSKLSEKNVSYEHLEKLAHFVQNDLVVVNLWSERNFKGYDYLNKSKRKHLYENTQLILNDFNKYLLNDTNSDVKSLIDKIIKLGVDISNIKGNIEKLIYINQIMRYLSPYSGRYAYRASSTFGELLKDPSTNKLEGDCNQIVTLYIYLYSRKYNVKDLRLLTYPGHVALHFFGVDIEATNGQFAHYDKPDQKILPIQEIISINLLDTTDSYFQTHKIPPESFLQSARLAYLVSSEKEIINNNLYVAYNNVVNEKLSKNDYVAALKYAKQSGKQQLINIVGYNGAAYFLNNDKFADARKFAAYSDDKQALIKKIDYSEAIYAYNKNDYHRALKIFKSINENDMAKKCYEGLFVEEQKKLGKIQTNEDLKQNRLTIHKMRDYAKRSGNSELIEYSDKIGKLL